MRPWKWFGLAGLAGVAATGAVLVRSERQRRAYTPDDVRARLHARHAEAAVAPQPADVPVRGGPSAAEPSPRRRHRLPRLLRRG